METYPTWNRALAQYFLQGVAYGSRIYLSVDDAVLDAIAQQQFETEPLNGSWRADLVAAVRGKVVTNDKSINLEKICFRDRDSVPNGVAFLAVCVLAAYDMKNSDKTSSKAYFERLRKILQLPGSGRPAEMKRASRSYTGFGDFEYLDEMLWREWNYWLNEQGFVSTARRGVEGSQKFINYPISQCLLRQADSDELWQYFDQHNLRKSLDAYTLFNKIRVDKQCFKTLGMTRVLERRLNKGKSSQASLKKETLVRLALHKTGSKRLPSEESQMPKIAIEANLEMRMTRKTTSMLRKASEIIINTRPGEKIPQRSR